MNKLQDQVQIRSMVPEDESFIYSSWLKSYRNSPNAANMPNQVFYDNHKRIIQNIINTAQVSIICSSEDSDHIFGFICWEPTDSNFDIYHYLYIKYPYRKMGLANYLFDSIGGNSGGTIVITHYNNNLRRKSTELGMIYNPYLIRNP